MCAVLEHDRVGIESNVAACTSALRVGEDAAAGAVDEDRLSWALCVFDRDRTGFAAGKRDDFSLKKWCLSNDAATGQPTAIVKRDGVRVQGNRASLASEFGRGRDRAAVSGTAVFGLLYVISGPNGANKKCANFQQQQN